LIPKYIPGNPNFIPQNMAGAGGRVANNFFTVDAKPDGLTLLQGDTNSLSSFTRGGSSVNYDPRKYETIGAIVRGGSLLTVRRDALARLKNKSTEPVIVGDIDGITSWVAMAVWGAEYLNWNLRFIYGYRGTQETALALSRGEIGMWGTTNAQTLKDLVKERLVDLVTQQDATRRSDFPEVPTFIELLGSKRPQSPAWEAYAAWAGPTSVDKFLAAPPGTPKEIVHLLRQAFDKMTKENEFKVQATKFFGEGWHSLSGDTAGTLIKESTTISPEVQTALSSIRKKHGLPQGTGE
jgi:tripartite-type tricarboxylate transporter receptor subunit TctC